MVAMPMPPPTHMVMTTCFTPSQPLADGSYTSTQVQNVAGLVSDATAVSLTVNGAPVALAADGSFSTSVTLLQGANALIIQAVDLAGNLTSLSRTITFDATKPVITVAAPVDNATTANTILAISGTVSEAAQVMVNGAPAPLDPTTLSWNASVTLLDGLNTVDIVAIDLAGNTSSLKRTVTLDTSKPLVAIVSPAQDLATNALSMAIQATASDNVSGVSQVTATVNGVSLALALPAAPLQMLAQCPFMRFDRRTWTGHLVNEALAQCRATVVEGMELNSVEAIVELVRQGFGISIVPRNVPNSSAKPSLYHCG